MLSHPLCTPLLSFLAHFYRLNLSWLTEDKESVLMVFFDSGCYPTVGPHTPITPRPTPNLIPLPPHHKLHLQPPCRSTFISTPLSLIKR